MLATSKELGIIFIINFPFDQFTDDNDTQNLQAKITNRMDGYFKFSNYKVNAKAEIYFVFCFSGLTENPDSPNTKVSRLKIDGPSVEGVYKYIEEPVINFNAVNIGNKDVLSSILKFVKFQINANKYILFLYNHSSAFGLFNTTADRISGVPDRGEIRYIYHREHLLDQIKILNGKLKFNKKDPENHRKKNFSRDEFLPGFKSDMLTNSELFIALRRVFCVDDEGNYFSQGIKIIFGGGCYFMNIDLAYTLKDVTHYLVGAEGVMPPPTYDYPTIINALFGELEKEGSADKIDYVEVIKKGISSISNSYLFNNNKKDEKAVLADSITQSWINSTFVSSIDCKKMDRLTNEFNNLLLLFFSESDIVIKTIIDVMCELDDLSRKYNSQDGPFHLYDLKNFIVSMNSQPKINDKLKESCVRIIKIIENELLVCEPFVDERATSKENLKKIFSGLSFYFPLNKEDAINSYNFLTFYGSLSNNETFFSKDTFWNNFINFYHKYLNRELIPAIIHIKKVNEVKPDIIELKPE